MKSPEASPHETVYDALVTAPGDSAHWAFGTDFDDPLAGLDTRVPDGVDAGLLAAYSLALADDALVLSHRLSQWCSRAPDLEEDIALANIALDLLGQARLLLARAAAADPSLVPPVPDGSPVPAEDALAFFRDAPAYRSTVITELENGDFAHAVVRVLLCSSHRLAVLTRLVDSADPVLAAVAAKGIPELTYHRDWSARWCVTLADGTEESRRRTEGAFAALWPAYAALLAPDETSRAAATAGLGADPDAVAAEVEAVLDQVLAAAGLPRPTSTGPGLPAGRDGEHTPALAALLAEMQVVARAHPLGRW